MNTVHHMVMLGGLMGVTMDKGGVSVLPQKIIRIADVQVHDIEGFLIRFLLALLTELDCHGAALIQGLGQEGTFPFRSTGLLPEFLIGFIMGAQGISMGKDKLPFRCGESIGIGQQLGATLLAEILSQQKVPVAMHDENRKTGGTCLGQCRDDFLVTGDVLVVISNPGFKQVSKNIKAVAGLGDVVKKACKDGSHPRGLG